MRRVLLVCLFFAAARLQALEFAHYDEAKREFDLAGNVWYYFEEFNEQQPHEALELLEKGYFSRAMSHRLSLGYTSKPVWVAIPFETTAAAAENLVLELTSLIDSIQLSYLNERGLILESFTTGRDYAMNTRPLAHHNFIFPLAVEASPLPTGPRFAHIKRDLRRRIILMRLKSEGSILLPLRLLPQSEFHAIDHLEQMVFGIYFGIMLVMVLYNLFLYASTRERSYAFYVLYILFFMMFQFAIWGFLHELVLPGYPRLAKYLLPAFLHLATLFQLLFAANFFQAQDRIPRLYKVSGWLSFLAFLSLLAGPFLPYRLFITMGILTGSTAALMVFTQALVLFLQHVRVARFFLVAYATLIGGVVFLALRNMGVINYSFISSYSAQIGSALEVILLSLALADRINLWRDEKERAQKQVIEREREMNRAFQLFVPSEFLRLAGESDFTRLTLGKSTTRKIAILFSDIRGFTTLSEAMSPEENFRFLNSYLSRMGPIIRRHGGFIDKFIGDAIMALFPEEQDNAGMETGSRGAVAAALEMRQALREYNQHRQSQGYQPIDTGIGIHSGEVRLGTIGENERWEGTVIGDTVNLASRIEALSATFRVPIVASEAIQQTLDAAQAYRELDTIRVKGKSKPVKICEIFSPG